jgi:hypothetical protein
VDLERQQLATAAGERGRGMGAGVEQGRARRGERKRGGERGER